MNAIVKKLSIRQVASLASLTLIALALPIGLYLTAITQDIRQEATEELPITPPTTPSPTPYSSGAPSYLEVISSPSSQITMSTAPNTGYGVNALIINTNTYEVVTDLSNIYFVWGSYGNGFFTLNASGAHADIEATSTGKAIVYATAFDSQSQSAIGTTYWTLNVTDVIPSPSPSPSPSITNKFDMNGDDRINITDYTLFIAGFINGLTQ